MLQWQTLLKNTYQIVKLSRKRFTEINGNSAVSALTLTSLLALVPLIVVSFSVLTAFPVSKNLSSQIQNIILSHFIPTSGETILHYLTQFAQQTSTLSLPALAFLFVTALLMIRAMEKTFNTIWQIKSKRHGISAFLSYWAVLTLMPLLLGMSLTLSSYVTSIPLLNSAFVLFRFTNLIEILSLLFTFFAFALIYIAIPNCRVPLKPALTSAFFAALCFEVAKRAFAFYVVHFTSYQVIYGTLAILPLFIIWLYVCWLIILVGAIVSNVLAYRYQSNNLHEFDAFTQAFRWLGFFWLAQQQGKTLSITALLKQDHTRYVMQPQAQINTLVHAHLIRRIGRGHYLLSRDLNRFTLLDLIRILPWPLPDITRFDSTDHDPWNKKLTEQMLAFVKKMQTDMSVPLASLYHNE